MNFLHNSQRHSAAYGGSGGANTEPGPFDEMMLDPRLKASHVQSLKLSCNNFCLYVVNRYSKSVL